MAEEQNAGSLPQSLMLLVQADAHNRVAPVEDDGLRQGNFQQGRERTAQCFQTR